MGLRILSGRSHSVLYCSTTDWAFGPIFYDSKTHDSYDRAEAFLEWLKVDAREFSDSELESKYSAWLAQEDEQWTAKEKETEDE